MPNTVLGNDVIAMNKKGQAHVLMSLHSSVGEKLIYIFLLLPSLPIIALSSLLFLVLPRIFKIFKNNYLF